MPAPFAPVTLAADAALALWLAQGAVATLGAALYRRGLPQPEIPGFEPPVAVILPVKGAGMLAAHLARLRAQSYRRYRIIAAVESAADPACPLLEAARNVPGAPIEVVVAGLARDTGQKVWNLLAALDRLTPEDEVVAFIDADTLPTENWLPRLVAVLVNTDHPIATGYRWMTADDGRWSSIGLAAANNSIASLPRGAVPLTIVWGGSVAMRRTTLDAIGVRAFWRGAISDDFRMADALRRAGLVAHAPRQALLLTPASCSWAEFFAFGVRQYRIVYLHRPGAWAAALALLWAPPLCFLVAAPALAAAAPSAWFLLAAVLVTGEVRIRLRRSLERALWPDIEGPNDDWRWRIARLSRPLWHLTHALAAAAAPLSRTIDWAGVRYRIRAPQDIVIERRPPVG